MFDGWVCEKDVADGSVAFDSRQYGQRRRCFCFARLPSAGECHIPLLAERGLWCRDRDEVSDSCPKRLPFASPLTTRQSLRVQHGLETYRYLSAGNFSNITPRWWLGAMHSCTLHINLPLVILYTANDSNNQPTSP
jgi:hypothetical protein